MPKFLQSEDFLAGWCLAWAGALALVLTGIL